MIEIKFRGKSIDTNEWIYGGIFNYSNHYGFTVDKWFITDNEGDNDEVQRGTVGQYTGLKDKNDVEIYEGDIVKISDFAGNYCIGKVEYFTDTCCYRIVGDLFNYALALSQEDIEVIGNIYDNPELMEGNKNEK